jgi:hypothetical protein
MMLEPANTSDAAKLPLEQHALVLHPPEDGKAATKYANEALRRGQLTVYVPITTDNNASYISDIASGIVNYEEKCEQRQSFNS